MARSSIKSVVCPVLIGRASVLDTLGQFIAQTKTNMGQTVLVSGEAWACGAPDPDEVDAVLLMWLMRGDVQTDRLPQNLVVVQYNFREKNGATYWLILTRSDVSVCVTDPGYGIDIVVTADLATYYELWYGRISYREALPDYGVTVEGTPHLVRTFPDWFAWRVATASAQRNASNIGVDHAT